MQPTLLGSAGNSAPTSSWLHGQQARGVHVIINVKNNHVDQAISRLKRECDAIGLKDELRKREAFIPSDDQKYANNRRVFNSKMGQKIGERLKWVMKRRKIR